MSFNEFKEVLKKELASMTRRDVDSATKYAQAMGMWKMWKMLGVYDKHQYGQLLDEMLNIVDEYCQR